MSIEQVDFPHRAWFSRGWSFKPVARGSDEFGQHTIYASIPFVGSLVIAYRICSGEGRCAEMAEFRCEFPMCPYMGLGGHGPCYCTTHDRELYDEILAEQESA